MTIRFLALGAAFFVAACGTSPVPDSNPDLASGVGFGTQEQFLAQQQAQRMARDAELQAMRTAALNEEQAIAAETMTALNVTPPASQPAITPLQPVTTVAAVEAGSDNPDISDEQNFDAVASRQTIETDADRLQRNRDQLQVVQPVAVPQRSGAGGPNIVAYALATNHPVGMPVHRRSGRTSVERVSRVCESYGTDDQAQQAFLSNGGPERDRKGVDPDGDGYACGWNPAPFRTARGG